MRLLAKFFFVACCAMIVGCSQDKIEIPDAPSAGDVKVFPVWSAITNAAALKAAHYPLDNTGAAVFHAPGVALLPVDFTCKNRMSARASWDFKIPCDLRFVTGIQFDFYCEDLSQFSAFNCYFKSGGGWYNADFAVEDNGVWKRVTVQKSACGSEGLPKGWGDISTIRISGWRVGYGKTLCAIANIAPVVGNPDLAIVYADSLAANGGPEAKSYMKFADSVSATLRAIGIESVIVADTDLNTNLFARVSAIVLPYNPQMPHEKIALVKDYVANGGKVFACYSQAQEILDVLGVKKIGMKRPSDDGGTAIAGFLKTGNGLAGQPGFVAQSSWITVLQARADGVEVVAEWADGKHKSLGIPALVRTKGGLYMSHVWLGGNDGAQADLMRAIVCDIAPELKKKMDAYVAEGLKKAEEVRAWLADRPSKRGEHRAFWCHNARGLGGSNTWETSVKFLKDNGFNVLIPNLCWGGVAFYDSSVLPVSKDVSVKGDALVQCRDACKKYGVKMHVWKVCWNMGSHTDKGFVDKMVAEGRTQVDVKGKARERWLCPSAPKNQELEINAMVELAKKGVDGIHFDYIRYPGTDCCFCSNCRERFQQILGTTVKNWPGDVSGAKSVPELKKAWHKFRAENITKVVKSVAERVRKEAPGVQISAALFRNPGSDSETVAQDWPLWCREGWLDFACHMDYVDSPAMFRNQIKAQMAVVGKVKMYPGIGLSCWQNDGEYAVKLANQIQMTRDAGLDGFTVFNFDRRAERVLPLMRIGVTRED